MTKAATPKKAPAAKKATTPKARKPRADKGGTHKPGAGRTAGAGKPQDAGLAARMKNVDKWLTLEKDVIKAAGIATRAKLTARVLQTMREGQRVLSEVEVAAVETACKPRGYSQAKTY